MTKLTEFAVETKLAKFAVVYYDVAECLAVETKLAKFAVETNPPICRET
jgi:hypothetical protein